MANKTIKSAIESMMFVWGEPLNIKDMADIFGVDKDEVYDCCKELQAEYEQEGRGIVIREVNKCFQKTVPVSAGNPGHRGLQTAGNQERNRINKGNQMRQSY